MCSSSSGGSSPASPTGLFLRPTGDANTKVYSNGRGLLLHVVNNEIVIGTFDHDALNPYNIEDEDDGAGDGDDISVGYSYSLAANAGDDYSNTLFSTNNNQLTFIGENSGVLGETPETPPYKLSIETALNVKIALPATFNGYINTDASNDDTDADTRKFAFSGGTISKTDVAATGEVPAHRTISVTAGKIYAPDTKAGTGKIINFEALDSYKLPTTPDIYEYYVIVTDENNDGTGEVRAMAALPTGTEFYVLGAVEGHRPAITIDGIKFTDKSGGGDDWEVKVVFKNGSDVEISVDGNTINIITTFNPNFSDLLEALQNSDAVKALVDVTTVAGYVSGNALITGTIGQIKLSGGAEAVSDGAAAIKAQVNIAGLIIEAATAGTAGNNLVLLPQSTPSDTSITVAANNNFVIIYYNNQATLADMITAINADTDSNALLDFVGTAGTDYDANTLLADVLFTLYNSVPEAGAAPPTANGTDEAHNTGKVYSYETLETLDTEDYLINLGP